jgi:hypothetical protein
MPIIRKPQSKGGSNLNWDLTSINNAQEGTFPAIIADILVEENVTKNKYQSTETEVVDVCRFLIAYTNDDDEVKFSQTYEFTVLGDERSNLMKFLTNARGKVPPLATEDDDDENQYDFIDELGRKIMVTIGLRTAKVSGKEYGAVVGVAPLAKKYQSDAPDINDLEIPSGRRTPIPKGLLKAEKPKKSAEKSKPAGDDEEDPF